MSWQDDAMCEQELADNFYDMAETEYSEIVNPEYAKKMENREKNTIL